MTSPVSIEGFLKADGRRFAVVSARFNHFIVDRLVDGAIDAIVRHGGNPEHIVVVRAPGAFELPMVVQQVALRGDFDAIIALGCVIRGATPHFDYVAGECAKGIAQVAMTSGVPVAFGVLTCDTIQQAIERAGTKAGNKGWEAAVSAIEMVDLYDQLSMEPVEDEDELGEDNPYITGEADEANPYVSGNAPHKGDAEGDDGEASD